ncbi:MAG TPA: hypothetical protein VFG21_08025, partial [Xanthomonadaceae bacterium]|nr:hypothetical protein [Xanthomonadaceae bacterium]
VRETGIDPALHPGARWFVDAWYVVRDDQDIFNTMGWREAVPVWGAGLSPPRWVLQLPSAFTAGTVLDAWLAAAPLSEWTGRTLIDSAEGRALVAVRARDEGSQYRYDYAVMNLDLTRPVTQGSEPDLVVERNLGLDAFAVTGAGSASMSEAGFEDGDTDPGNDWIAATDALGTTWTAPQPSAELAWGQLMGFSLTSAHPPGDGGLALRFAEAGSPATLTAAGLAPDAAKIFSSRFE